MTTVRRGIAELKKRKGDLAPDRVRRKGGGRKSLNVTQPGVVEALERLVDPMTRGDPESPLRWTCKSTGQLAEGLRKVDFEISASSVGRLLKEAGYSLQTNQKVLEGTNHPDRNKQFEYINTLVRRFQNSGQPVISVDTKKKELIGPFFRGGREWQPTGEPQAVRVHDFLDPELGKAIPYGVYDLTANRGWVSVGIDHDTAKFAAATIKRWWNKQGIKLYRDAKELLITADGGGSNGWQNRLWKVELQGLAREIGIPIWVSHLPPGTSKWNKIEHRMFSVITQNWRGRPLISHEVIVKLIAGTRTKTGLSVQAELDTNSYETQIKISDEEMARLRIKRAKFHGEWNYRILP